jgi:hypothetical protein
VDTRATATTLARLTVALPARRSHTVTALHMQPDRAATAHQMIGVSGWPSEVLASTVGPSSPQPEVVVDSAAIAPTVVTASTSGNTSRRVFRGVRFSMPRLSHDLVVRDSLSAMRALIAVLLFAACKDKPAAPPVAVAPAPPPVKAARDDVRGPGARCLYACLTLDDTPLDQAPAAYAKACHKPWPYAPDDCAALRYARTCIDASYGRVFERREWIDRFTHTAWYQPRASFVPTEMSAIAAANARALETAEAACRATIPAVTAADRALAKTWFTKLMSAHPQTIEGVFTDPANLHRDLEGVVLDEAAQLTYQEIPVKGRRTIVVEHLRRTGGGIDADRVLKLSFVDDELTGVGW